MEYDIKAGVKGLIFDLDGTLIDSMPHHLASWKKACAAYGIFMDVDYLSRHAGTPGWLIAEELVRSNGLEGKVSSEQIIGLKSTYYAEMQKSIKPVYPVVEIVKKYHGILPMSVGTGGNRATVERSLEVTGLSDYFDILVTASDIDNFKPHPETFLKCAEAMGVDPSEIEVFEDGDLGIKAAEAAGMIPTNVKEWYDSNWEKEF